MYAQIVCKSKGENWKNKQDNRLSVDESVGGFKISVVHKEGTPPIANSEDDIAD